MSGEDRNAPFKFQVGDVIHHRRYGYRGAVFGRDPSCAADEAWYQKNQTQPARDQPWYHVLVHGHTHTTYVAESSLEPDPTREPIVHPLLEKFFSTFLRGKYHPENLN